MGEAAVSAGLISSILLVIVAITGIASFAIPDYTFDFHLRFFRFIFILLSFISGFFGIGLGLFTYISLICSLRSFGVPYATPFAPSVKSKGNRFLLPHIWKRENRPSYIFPQKGKEQEKYAMKWKYNK